MNAPAKKPEKTELDRLMSRLRSAAYSLEDAASSAENAVDELSNAYNAPEGAHFDEDLEELTQLVLTMHDEHHEGPRRWCAHAVCKRAYELAEVPR